jgi:hypothetical protein
MLVTHAEVDQTNMFKKLRAENDHVMIYANKCQAFQILVALKSLQKAFGNQSSEEQGITVAWTPRKRQRL